MTKILVRHRKIQSVTPLDPLPLILDSQILLLTMRLGFSRLFTLESRSRWKGCRLMAIKTTKRKRRRRRAILGIDNNKEWRRVLICNCWEGLIVGRRDAATLFFLVSFLSGAYG